MMKNDIDYHSFIAGLSFIAALAAGGQFIHTQAVSGDLFANYGALFVSLFIGTSTGHYLGKAVEQQSRSVNYAYLGAFIALSAYWLWQNQVSYLSLSLILMSVSLFLAHDSLIGDSKNIRQLVGYFADGISPIGVVVFGVLKFVGPAIAFEPIFQIVIDSLTQKVNILGAKINIIIFTVMMLGMLLVLLLTATSNSSTAER